MKDKPKSSSDDSARRHQAIDPMEFGPVDPMVFGDSEDYIPQKLQDIKKVTNNQTSRVNIPSIGPFSVSLTEKENEGGTLGGKISSIVPSHSKSQPEVQRQPSRSSPYQVARSLIARGLVVSASKLLYFFNGKSFQPCRKEEAEKKIVESCRDAVAAEGRPSFVRQVYQALLQEPEICRDEQLHLNVVAFNDCLLDLGTFQTQPHTQALFVTSEFLASYYRGHQTDCPVFQHFLEVVSGNDITLQKRIWQMIGYLLAPDQTGKVFFLLQGAQNSGKTVLGNFIRGCFAGDVVSALDVNELGGEFALSDLVGKKLCVDFDLPADPFNKRAVSKLKKLTGGDPTSSNVKFADRVKFVNTAKLLFATNHAALIPNQDAAFFDRMVVIPFTVSVPREAQDRQLPQKLEKERDAIIVQALVAYRELVSSGYLFAGSYRPNESISTSEAKDPVDAVTQFLVELCDYWEGNWTPTEQLYAAFIDKYGLLCGKNEFSGIALRLCGTLYPGAERKRGRVTPSSNPTWGFAGLKLKEDNSCSMENFMR